MKVFITQFILFSLSFVLNVNSEVFSAISKMKLLLQTLNSIIYSLEEVINTAGKNRDILEKYLTLLKIDQQEAEKDVSKFFGNPVTCFLLIKKLTVDLKFVGYTTEIKKNEAVIYPTQKDLKGAAEGLLRLQSMYGLSKVLLANGIWNTSLTKGRTSLEEKFRPMTFSDCYELGKTMCELNYFADGIEWLKIALMKYEEDNAMKNKKEYYIKTVNIKEQINYCNQGVDNLVKKLNELFKVSLLQRELHDVNEIVNSFKNGLTPEAQFLVRASLTTSEQNNLKAALNSKIESNLCKGEIQNMYKQLKCYLVYGPDPFLLLAPLKAEQLHLVPDVTLLYEVMSDDDILQLKSLAMPKLARTSVSMQRVNSTHRVSQEASIDDRSMNLRIRLKVAQFSGLNLAYAENLLVQNYGIGGHYSPHYDYFLTQCVQLERNRIATALFYMSDVELGGATVFPRLGLSVHPVKGAVLFWINLLSSTRGNRLMIHSACPVLRGSKWVTTLWISLQGQELLWSRIFPHS